MRLTEILGKKILLSPLNWGMGHVSRCIALIEKLKYNNFIIVACNTQQREILEQYHSEIEFVELSGYPFQFNERQSFAYSLLKNYNHLAKHMKYEQVQCEIICKKKLVDLVISDHRYGFYSLKTPSVFLTHQVNLPLPRYLQFINSYHLKLVRKFDEIWVVDDPILNLAGKLSSNNETLNCYNIGLLSRFENQNPLEIKNGHYLILSGPSAYWEYLINTINLDSFDGIIGPSDGVKLAENLKIPLHLSSNWKELDHLLLHCTKLSGYIGYTTLMDTYFLKCDTNLIACPGQLEQKYLEKIHNKKGYSMSSLE
jgi:hypothetical protein